MRTGACCESGALLARPDGVEVEEADHGFSAGLDVADVRLAADQPRLLRGEEAQAHGALGRVLEERAGDLEQGRHPAGVVVGARTGGNGVVVRRDLEHARASRAPRDLDETGLGATWDAADGRPGTHRVAEHVPALAAQALRLPPQHARAVLPEPAGQFDLDRLAVGVGVAAPHTRHEPTLTRADAHLFLAHREAQRVQLAAQPVQRGRRRDGVLDGPGTDLAERLHVCAQTQLVDAGDGLGRLRAVWKAARGQHDQQRRRTAKHRQRTVRVLSMEMSPMDSLCEAEEHTRWLGTDETGGIRSVATTPTASARPARRRPALRRVAAQRAVDLLDQRGQRALHGTVGVQHEAQPAREAVDPGKAHARDAPAFR